METKKSAVFALDSLHSNETFDLIVETWNTIELSPKECLQWEVVN